MKADGMLDDPSYVAVECECSSNWVKYESEDIEIIPTELDTKTATPVAKAAPASGAIHLTEFTCACIVIFALQAVICFGMLSWCYSKTYKIERQKVTKQSEFYEFLYDFHEQMANEADANAAINGTPGGTPGGPTPGRKAA
jgi:hypothetical protein